MREARDHRVNSDFKANYTETGPYIRSDGAEFDYLSGFDLYTGAPINAQVAWNSMKGMYEHVPLNTYSRSDALGIT